MTSLTAPLLAFGFSSPWLLWGLGLAAVPVVIHLLHRREYHEMPWAAMRFLREAARKQSRRLQFEQLLLLAVRTLLIVLLVLALARPHVEPTGGMRTLDRGTHYVLVLDASFSMAYRKGRDRVFDGAREAARRLVGSAGAGDVFHLLRIGGSEPRVIIGEPAHRAADVVAEIDRLEPTEEFGDVIATLDRIPELLGRQEDALSRKIVLWSDFQTASWHPTDQADRDAISRRLRQLAQRAELILVDVAPPDAANACLSEIAPGEPIASVGQMATIRGEVSSFGPRSPHPRRVEFFVDGRLVGSRSVEAVPGTVAPVEFSHEFLTAGWHLVELRLDEDALPVDDRRWLVLPVRDELRLLLVNGRYAGRPQDAATFFVETALAPSSSSEPASGLLRPHVVDAAELTAETLGRFDCVILCDVALLTTDESDRLRAYVEQGGGLVVALGEQVQLDGYNRLLFRGGAGPLPARLVERVGDPTTRQPVFRFDAGAFDHPIVAPFRGNPGAGLETTLTYAYVRAEVQEARAARVALRFDSGDPAILTADVGRGRSVLLLTSCDTRWSTWVASPSFVPLIHELVRYCVARRWHTRQHLVGQPLRWTAHEDPRDAAVTVTPPRGQPTAHRLADDATLVFEATTQSGVYEVRVGPPVDVTEPFAVNVNPLESDVRSLTREQLQADLLSGALFRYATGAEDLMRPGAAPLAAGRQFSRWLLAGVLALLFVELLMAWRFARGLVLLCVVSTVGVVLPVTLRWPLWGGLLLVLTVVIVLIWLAHRASGQRGSAGEAR